MKRALVHFPHCSIIFLPAGVCRPASCGTVLPLQCCCWRRRSERLFSHHCPKWNRDTVSLIKKWDCLVVWLEIPILIRRIGLPYFPLSNRTCRLWFGCFNVTPISNAWGQSDILFLFEEYQKQRILAPVWQLSLCISSWRMKEILKALRKKRWTRVFLAHLYVKCIFLLECVDIPCTAQALDVQYWTPYTMNKSHVDDRAEVL